MLAIRFTHFEVPAATHRLAAGLHCASLMEKHSSPQQMAVALFDTPQEVKHMLLAYYEARQAHEFCTVVRASLLD